MLSSGFERRNAANVDRFHQEVLPADRQAQRLWSKYKADMGKLLEEVFPIGTRVEVRSYDGKFNLGKGTVNGYELESSIMGDASYGRLHVIMDAEEMIAVSIPVTRSTYCATMCKKIEPLQKEEK